MGQIGKADGRYFKTAINPKTGKARYGGPVVIDLPEPPLDRETFDALQGMLDAAPRAGASQEDEQRQWLSTRIVEPAAGNTSGFWSWSGTGSAGRFAGQRNGAGTSPEPGCTRRQIDAVRLDAAVWAKVVGVLGDSERLLRLASEWTRQGATSEADNREVEKLSEQARKLGRAIERAADEAFMAEDPEVLLGRVARHRAQLAEVKPQLDLLQSNGLEARHNARQFTELADLADRAAERLRHLTVAERLELAELLDLLDLRVEVAGSFVGGLPQTVLVRGVLDPRLG